MKNDELVKSPRELLRISIDIAVLLYITLNDIRCIASALFRCRNYNANKPSKTLNILQYIVYFNINLLHELLFTYKVTYY